MQAASNRNFWNCGGLSIDLALSMGTEEELLPVPSCHTERSVFDLLSSYNLPSAGPYRFAFLFVLLSDSYL